MKKLAVIKLTQDKGAESYLKALKRKFKDNIVLFDNPSSIKEELREFFKENPLFDYLVLEPCDIDIKRLLLCIRNLGIDIERRGRYPITPTAIFKNLKEMVDLEGKTVCILNRTERIGKPLAMMLADAGATVTVCNSKTDSEVLEHMCFCSDIVITATNGIETFRPRPHQIIVDVSNDLAKYKNETIRFKYISTSEVGKWTLDELERRMEE